MNGAGPAAALAPRPAPQPSRVAEAELRDLLPALDDRALAAALEEARRLETTLEALDHLRARSGAAALAPHIRLSDPAGVFAHGAAARPAVFITWHLGAARHLAAALAPLGLLLLVARRVGSRRPASSAGEVLVGPDLQGRARALGQLLLHVRGGGSALLAIDARGLPRLPVTCLGRRISFARGAFALARLTGAPVIPVVALAAEPTPLLQVDVQEPLTGGAAGAADQEAALGAEAARRLDGLVRRHPGQLLRGLVERLKRASPF